MTWHTSWRCAFKSPRVLLSALIPLVTLIGCGGGGGGRIDIEGPFADNLGGTLSQPGTGPRPWQSIPLADLST
jgi:hypothetical protein